MTRYLFHDLNPPMFPLRAAVRRFATTPCLDVPQNGGAVAPPAAVLRFAADHLDDDLFLSSRSELIRSGSDLRSLVCLAHPIARIAHVFQKQKEQGRYDSLEKAVEESLAASPNGFYCNFQTACLLGGAWNAPLTAEDGRKLGEVIAENAEVCLADFPDWAASVVLGCLLQTRAQIHDRVVVKRTAQNQIVRSIEMVRGALSADRFNVLLRRCEADLALFQAVAGQALQRGALPPDQEGLARAALEEAASMVSVTGAGAGQDAAASAASRQSLYRSDDALGWWPEPEAAHRLTILGRRIEMNTDRGGFRRVPNQPKQAARKMEVYGCSFTFGWGVPDEETLPAVLQDALPEWRVENHGMNGFGTAHSLRQLQQNLVFETPDVVTFCWIPAHLRRAAGTPDVIQGYQSPQWRLSKIEKHPAAFLAGDGSLQHRMLAFKRPDLQGIDLSDFYPSDFYLSAVTHKLVLEAHKLVTEAGGRFFLTILRGALPGPLRRDLEADGIQIVDAALDGTEYTLLPDDGHPNALAYRIFAERILGAMGEEGESVLKESAEA